MLFLSPNAKGTVIPSAFRRRPPFAHAALRGRARGLLIARRSSILILFYYKVCGFLLSTAGLCKFITNLFRRPRRLFVIYGKITIVFFCFIQIQLFRRYLGGSKHGRNGLERLRRVGEGVEQNGIFFGQFFHGFYLPFPVSPVLFVDIIHPRSRETCRMPSKG